MAGPRGRLFLFFLFFFPFSFPWFSSSAQAPLHNIFTEYVISSFLLSFLHPNLKKLAIFSSPELQQVQRRMGAANDVDHGCCHLPQMIISSSPMRGVPTKLCTGSPLISLLLLHPSGSIQFVALLQN
ncbi:unnamed protein product [Cuscuta epithymum]|uniref:Secreted protein n=1 Tax=Cuscuta epithymum TaxID=186058 RepID=A0AAV0DEM3_9ASTE|nr:unnamed protein product [Cuscuta epithymum]